MHTSIDTPANAFALCALLLTVIAAGWDLAVRRIPNPMTVTAMLLGLAGHLALASGSGLAWSAAGLAVGLGLLLIPALFGGMGGGDVKLMAALGAILGPALIFQVALASAVAGGLLALGVAFHGRVAKAAMGRAIGSLRLRRQRLDPSAPAATPPRALGTIPYGVAIGAGTWFCVLGGRLF